MPVNVVMPKLGLTMVEGKIIKWVKKKGDQVLKGDVIFILETEKITFEVESPESGVLGKICVNEDEIASVGTVVACIFQDGESCSAEECSEKEITEVQRPTEEDVKENKDRLIVSPVAKKIALEKGIDLTRIKGTGPNGRIVKEDVFTYINQLEQTKSAQPDRQAPAEENVEWDLLKLTTLRQTIARRMSNSFYSAPHTYFTTEVEAVDIIKCRKDLISYIEKEKRCRLTITDLLIKITAKALREFPLMNASWSDEGIRIFRNVNIGIATAVEDGLLVPVIRNSDERTLAEISAIRSDLSGRAQERKLSLDEMTGGTFTITNLGMFEIDFFSAIINPPESAILAVSSIKERPVVKDGQIVASPTMYLTLTVDHRVVQGAYAAKFLQRVKELANKTLLAFQ